LIAGAFTHVPIITTIHNPVQYKFGVKEVYQRYQYISISNSERAYNPDLDYVATVYHGIDIDSFEYNDHPGDYLAFLGRIDPDKGIEEAIEIAKRSNHKLIIAAKLDLSKKHYYRHKIKPLIDGKQIIYVGEVAHSAKVALLKNARALLSPIQWEEPFGLTNVEAMACGTPVIATPRGAHMEIIAEGKTGFLRETVEEMAACVADLPKLSRRACRTHVSRRFTSAIMAKNYVTAYDRVIRDHGIRMLQHLKTMKSLLIP
jgi:glycosyltransferase involved in cell wall biosynthesis